jgi:hypothetical protein
MKCKSLSAAGFLTIGLLALGVRAQTQCPDPIDINCGDVVTGDTTDAPRNIDEYSCFLPYLYEIGGERPYRLVLPEEKTVSVTASADDYRSTLALYILPQSGDDCSPSNCITGIISLDLIPSTVRQTLRGGTYYIVVDSNHSMMEGAFELEVICEDCTDADGDGHHAFEPLNCLSAGVDCCDTGMEQSLGCTPDTDRNIYPGAHENCNDDIDSDCNGLNPPCMAKCLDTVPISCGQRIFDGNLQTSSNIVDYSCFDREMNGRERYYLLTLHQPAEVTATLYTEGTLDPESYDLAIAIAPEKDDDCDPGACLAGADEVTGLVPEVVTANLEAGRYFIIVDSFGERARFEIEVDCSGCRDMDKDTYLGNRSVSCPSGRDCCDTGDEPALGCTPNAAPIMHPGRPEICEDGIDQDCDGEDMSCACDVDRDGHAAPSCGGDDCNDDDPDVHPGAPELCNDLDDDCDGETDEGLDADSDGYNICDPEPDCDDNDETIHPGAEEICGDYIDQDCDGADEECTEPDPDPEPDSNGCGCGSTPHSCPWLIVSVLMLGWLRKRRRGTQRVGEPGSVGSIYQELRK